jgi:P27 family predicted phage terminase small subunit
MKIKSTVALSKEAQAWFDTLQNNYSITDEAGLLLLQSGIEAFDRMRQAQRLIKKHGVLVKDSRWDQLKQNPAVALEISSRGQLLACLKALNMDMDNVKEEF